MKVLRRYQVPGIGRIEIRHDEEPRHCGPYYAHIEGYGCFAKFSETEEEARCKAGDCAMEFLKSRKADLENQLGPVQVSLGEMQLQSFVGLALNTFEVK